MTLNEHFLDLFKYNHHYNQQFINILKNKLVEDKLHQLMSHIVNAHQIWNYRILNQVLDYGVWEVRKPDTLIGDDKLNFEYSVKIIQDTDLDKTILYINTKGEQFTSKVSEIIFHIINHSTYHRAQISSALKAAGIEPIISDYIFYKRSH